VRTWK